MKKLNLGCGYNKLNGYINLDYEEKNNPDIVWNLNSYPYPFTDNEFDYIRASNIIEHITDVTKAMNELWRITKSTGEIYISVPHYNHIDSYSDVTHIHFFSPDSFDMFAKDEECYHITDRKFVMLEKNIVSSGFGRFVPKRLLWCLSLMIGNLVSRIEVRLRPIKEKKVKL